MNRRFSRWTAAFFAAGASLLPVWAGQTAQTALPVDADKTIARIRGWVAETDVREKACRKVERDLEGFSTEGGDVTGWFKGNALVKMTARYFGESGKATDEYYLRNSVPIFVLHTDVGYDRMLSGKVAWRESTRYYWDAQGKLVFVLDDKKRPRLLTDGETRKQTRELTEAASKLAALLRAPKNNKPDPH